METGPLNRISMVTPVETGAGESMELARQLVIAIRGLNQSGFLEQGRQLKLRRAAARKRPAVDVVDVETGEILDELEPEDVLRMMTELEHARKGEWE